MRRIVAGEREIDACTACGALWFDFGEIRELTEGRVPGLSGEGSPEQAPAGPPPKENPGARLSRVREAAASPRCPRCHAGMTAIDFQATGIPVLRCPSCEGILAPRESAADISARFRFLRVNRARYEELGKTLAEETRRKIEFRYGPDSPKVKGEAPIPLPVVVPLADDGPRSESLPIATYSLIGAALFLYIIGQMKGARLPLPGLPAGLPSGTGFSGIPKLPLLVAPFFHAGLLPLGVGSLFLFVLGDNVEDRMGRVPFLLLFLFCGAVSGAAHVLWGKAGGPPAMGSAGAVAGILGAFLVFFPNVSIRMYGMGSLLTIPAYLFACAWVTGAFFLEWGSGPIEELLFPAALSLAGNLAGFGTGVAGAIVWRNFEEAAASRAPA